MISRALAVAALATVACREDTNAPLRLEVPVRPEHKAVVIAVEEGTVLEVHAQAIENGAIEPLERAIDADTRVTVLLYTEPLADLEIEAGELMFVEGGRPLPTPAVMLENRPGMTDSWSEVQERTAAIDAFRIGGAESACHRFSPITLSLGPAPAYFALALAGRGVLVSTSDGALRLFTPDHAMKVLSTAPQFFDAHLDKSRAGTVELASSGGEIWRGTFSTATSTTIELTRISTLGTSEPVLYFDGDLGSDAFAQTDDRSVYHFDGTTWTNLGRIDGRGRSTGIVRVAPGVALSAWGDCLCLLQHSPAGTEEVPVPANSVSGNGVSTLFHDTSYGTIAGSFIGEIMEARENPQQWKKIEGTYSTIEVTSVALYHDAFVYADERGVAVERVAKRYCDPLPPEHPSEVKAHVAIFGEDIVVASDVVTWWVAER